MKRILSVAAVTITICLITDTAYSQSTRLRLRFHVPFAFSAKNETFPAG